MRVMFAPGALTRPEREMVAAVALALRAFYEVVGAVDWIGEHPSLAPRHDSVAPDPLVVFLVDRTRT
jgi:hypothetical protein